MKLNGVITGDDRSKGAILCRSGGQLLFQGEGIFIYKSYETLK